LTHGKSRVTGNCAKKKKADKGEHTDQESHPEKPVWPSLFHGPAISALTSKQTNAALKEASICPSVAASLAVRSRWPHYPFSEHLARARLMGETLVATIRSPTHTSRSTTSSRCFLPANSNSFRKGRALSRVPRQVYLAGHVISSMAKSYVRNR
jgi:hypothetical protein